MTALTIASLKAAYQAGDTTPEVVLADIFRRIAEFGERPVWITLAPADRVAAKLAELRRRQADGEVLPLAGIPFAVKDNIDVAGLPTSAACPEFAYVPERSATVVERLKQAGAILVGKTNLDQFATGLVGTRSPYGICASVFHPDYVSGGSSSGSAVAVASGLVSFALGTDTAGSGRVPAAFNNLVGLKPTKGLVSTRGVVPACRSQDCVSIFARSVDDAATVLACAEGFDIEDSFSRGLPTATPAVLPGPFRFGVPREPLEFFGDEEAERLFEHAIARLSAIGGIAVPIDFAPFEAAAKLLYGGAWVAERLAALQERDFTKFDSMHPVVREIVLGSEKLSALDAFKASYRLAELCRAAEAEWAKMDLLLLPTTGTIYRIADVLTDPIRLNSNLGLYTNFVNLMDLSALAVPAGFRPNGLPFGVTLVGPAFADARLQAIGARLERAGVTSAPSDARIEIAVVGAHLTGQPLNWQLTTRNARFVGSARTAPGYRLYALDGTKPAKPGLVRDPSGAGLIELEIWELDAAGFGSFVSEISAPLGIGTLSLESGGSAKGFLCEAYAVRDATEITAFGGWRTWLKSRTGGSDAAGQKS